jgi:hypothetical protein
MPAVVRWRRACQACEELLSRARTRLSALTELHRTQAGMRVLFWHQVCSYALMHCDRNSARAETLGPGYLVSSGQVAELCDSSDGAQGLHGGHHMSNKGLTDENHLLLKLNKHPALNPSRTIPGPGLDLSGPGVH